jgi:hypothetical protein
LRNNSTSSFPDVFTVLGFGNCQCGDVIGRVLDAPITRVQGCPKDSFDSPVGVNH